MKSSPNFPPTAVWWFKWAGFDDCGASVRRSVGAKGVLCFQEHCGPNPVGHELERHPVERKTARFDHVHSEIGRLLPPPKAWDSKVHKAAIETVRLAREALLDDQNGDQRSLQTAQLEFGPS
jgi:hypothetical protein